MAVPVILYTMLRGDSRSLPVSLPIDTYSTGASIFFGMKQNIDDDLTDSSAYAKTTMTDANITSITDTEVNYLLQLTPSQTTVIPPGTYYAEFEFVSEDGNTIVSWPDQTENIFKIQVLGDVNRRT